ncbi:MAG: penicillin-binding protein [Chloroflexi bacterium]|nr:penicillin-binding protein [Chloroflexota bacterium]
MARQGASSRYLAYRRRRHSSKRGMSRWLIALIVLGGLFAVATGVFAGVGYGVYRSYADDLVPPDEAIAKLPRSGARILDRDGRFLYQFIDDQSGIRQPVPVEDFWPWLVLATVAAEDASFFDNPGVNFRGLAAAAWENFSPFGDTPGFLGGRGGSSITQQLVKNVYFAPEERAERSIERKLKETVLALELTRKYEKSEILGWYLNLISYGSIYNGAEAAAQGYFGKHAKDLTLAEAATLAAIPSCPSCYDPVNQPDAAFQQRNRVLRRMFDEGFIDGAVFFATAAEPLEVKPQRFPVRAPHFVFNVVQPELERLFGEEALRRDDLVVFTTLDLEAQSRAEAILEEWITTFESSGGHNGAVVAINPKTAAIEVYVGSRDYFREDIDGQNDMADALNSPGSSFKPFTYVTAFMERGWGPGTMVLDTEFPAEFWDGDRPPRNPGTGFQGPITLRNALGSSLNIPAIKTIMYTGVLNVITQARKMGISTLDEQRLGPSLTVGGVDVKLADMVYGYTVFPNLGTLKGVPTQLTQQGSRPFDPISIVRVENRDGEVLYPIVDGKPKPDGPVVQEEQVAPAQETYLINSILSDGSAQCIVFGCGGLSIPGRPLAVKTGTSEPFANSFNIGDTWAIAYTPQLVVGSWFGNADNSPMFDISSTSVSWRTVRDFMIEYHQDLPVEPFIRPDGLVTAETCVPSGLRPTNACPLTTPGDLFASASLPQADDDWWVVAEIDTRTGKLASDLTPPQFVEEHRFLQLPEGLSAFERNQALEWAEQLETGVGEAPTERTELSDLPIAITSPANASSVQGVVTITGRADSPDFVSYRLEFRFQGDISDWSIITESDHPVPDGTLGSWDTRLLTAGVYTVRLILVDGELGDVIARVTLLVLPQGDEALPTTEPGPTATADGLSPGGANRGPPPGRGPPSRE